MSTNIREIEVQNFCEEKLTTQNSTSKATNQKEEKKEKREKIYRMLEIYFSYCRAC